MLSSTNSSASMKATSAPRPFGLPAKLGDMAVLAFMESYEKDRPGTGADCDNLGKDAINTLRFLLVARNAAAGLFRRPATAADAAAAFSRAFADRLALDARGRLASDFVARYRKAATTPGASWLTPHSALYPALGARIADLFAKDPAPDWLGQLDKHDQAVAQGRIWPSSISTPSSKTWSIPGTNCGGTVRRRHGVSAPTSPPFPSTCSRRPGRSWQLRTGRYLALLAGRQPGGRVHACCLVQKLDTLIATFQAPVDAKLSPSASPQSQRNLPSRSGPFFFPLA